MVTVSFEEESLNFFGEGLEEEIETEQEEIETPEDRIINYFSNCFFNSDEEALDQSTLSNYTLFFMLIGYKAVISNCQIDNFQGTI